MVGISEGAMIPRQAGSSRSTRAAHSANWLLATLLSLLLLAAIAAVVVALSSGMPTVAIAVALVTGAVFAGVLC